MNYTSIKQSLELLSLGIDAQTACMCYNIDSDGGYIVEVIQDSGAIYNLFKVTKDWHDCQYVPCWSVVDLLELVPTYKLWKENRDGSTKYCIVHDWYQSGWHDTITEAVIDIIEQLH